MWDSIDKVIPDLQFEQLGDTCDMATFLRTTKPPAVNNPSPAMSEDRMRRKKMLPHLPPLFKRKKDSFMDGNMEDRPWTSAGGKPRIVQRISKDGAKYFEILSAQGALDSRPELYEYAATLCWIDHTDNHSSDLFEGDTSPRLSASRATSNLDAIGTEDVASWITTFDPVDTSNDLSSSPTSILEAKAIPGSKPGQEYLSIKGPSVFASQSSRDSGMCFSMLSSDYNSTLIDEDLADLIARADMISNKDYRKRSSTSYSEGTITRRVSNETLATVRTCRSRSERRSIGETDQVSTNRSPRQSVAGPTTSPSSQHQRGRSVLDLDAQFSDHSVKEEIECHARRATLRHKTSIIGRDRLHRPPPLTLPPKLPAMSPDIHTPINMPELDAGLSSSESSSFGDQPVTPGLSPQRPRNRQSRQRRSISSPPRPAPMRYITTLEQPPNFLNFANSPPPARSQPRSGSLASVQLLNTSFPAPPMSPPPPPPTRPAPPLPSTASIISSDRTSVSSASTTFRDSMRIARLEARLAEAEREKQNAELDRDKHRHNFHLMAAALQAMLMTNGRLNRCPCSLGEDFQSPLANSQLTTIPGKCDGPSSDRASAITANRCTSTDSVGSAWSHMSALDVFRATRIDLTTQ